ncbi:carbohydrate ABC transporter permease [Lapidilactobacillus mulanensis]|uniref:Carbohydrate ABC transporter permease n=1 Tax=Lapidilactobacillus mulanensis TaxID=2485999 RepID=A0ABW4DKE4_9LACO|nr:carbohydrate ABC transporter permease [Lapidilactobacillus mulanensis]
MGETKKNRIRITLSLILMIFLAIIVMIPFYFMLVASFKDTSTIFSNGLNVDLNFKKMNLDSYKSLWTNRNGIYWQWFKNSLIITILETVLVLAFTSMVGYGLAQYDFKGRKTIFAIVLIMMMVPSSILLLPLYKLVTQLGLMNTYAGVILPGIVPASAIFFFRQFCLGLSREFAESARIDGCGEFRIFWQIYVPLMKPAFGAMTILTTMNSWNDFLWPLIVMKSDANFVIPAGLLSAMTPYGNNYQLLFAGSVMSVIPILIVFALNQNQFIEGLTSGGVKG